MFHYLQLILGFSACSSHHWKFLYTPTQQGSVSPKEPGSVWLCLHYLTCYLPNWSWKIPAIILCDLKPTFLKWYQDGAIFTICSMLWTAKLISGHKPDGQSCNTQLCLFDLYLLVKPIEQQPGFGCSWKFAPLHPETCLLIPSLIAGIKYFWKYQ